MTEQITEVVKPMQDVVIKVVVAVCLAIQPITAYYVKSAADKLEKVYDMALTSAIKIEASDMRHLDLDKRSNMLRERVDRLAERVYALEGKRQ